VRVAQAALAALALLLLARPAGHAAGRLLAGEQAATAWEEVRTGARAPRPGDPVARLRVPSAGIDVNVLDDATAANLHRLPSLSRQGHSAEGPGLKIVLGHRDTHFNPLKHAAPGDIVHWDTRSGPTRYRIASIRVLPAAEAEAHLATLRGPDRLVLVTCFPFRHLGPAPDRWLAACEPLR
jgi:sortase A